MGVAERQKRVYGISITQKKAERRGYEDQPTTRDQRSPIDVSYWFTLTLLQEPSTGASHVKGEAHYRHPRSIL